MGLLSTLGGIAGGFFGGGPIGAAVGSAIGGALEGGSEGSEEGRTATSAAGAANTGAQSQIDLQRRMYEEGIARQQPFYQASVNALPGYLQGVGQGGELVRGFTQADYQADPGYAFRMSEGMKGLERSAAARGGLMSGATLKGIQRYGQDLASQEYSNAYNRFRDTQGLQRNALAGVVGYGPTSANAMGNMGQNYATSAGNAMYNQGVNTGNALIAAQQGRQSTYGDLGSALGKYLGGANGTGYGGAQAAFSQTGLGGSGFGSGLAYGNEDLGQYY
jgi:hypothetical protein